MLFSTKIKIYLQQTVRFLSLSSARQQQYKCEVLVVGGGAGGCSVAARMSRRLDKCGVIVLDPAQKHYYQPYFTLVGAGVKKLRDCERREREVLPPKALWVKDAAETFRPEQNLVTTMSGDKIYYDVLVVAVGVENNYEKIPGLKAALDSPVSRVSTIYAPEYAEKVWSDIQAVKCGELLFTFPTGLIKCPGAPQKICYLTDSYHRKMNTRHNVGITYNTALPVLFGVKKYADALWKVVQSRDINVNLQFVLKEVHHETKQAVFEKVEDPASTTLVHYDLLHAVPPMSAPECLRTGCDFTDCNGYLDVDMITLRHKKYDNVFGLGDCTNTPNSKTAAAVATQSHVVENGVMYTLRLSDKKVTYDGYGACPLVTSYDTAIMAEFDYNLNPKETVCFNQAVERKIFYRMKQDLFPFLYWNMQLKGYWNGPGTVRRFFNPFAK